MSIACSSLAAPLRHVGERLERLLEKRDGLLVARARGGLGPGLAEIADRLLPRFPADRVVRQALDLLAQAVAVEALERIHHPRVQRLAAGP